MHPLRRRYRTTGEKRTGGRATAGIQHEISGRNDEAESEPGKEPDSQRIRHPKF